MNVYSSVKINPVLILLLFSIICYACRKESFYIDGTASIAPSADTLLFDTVFTTVGSATRSLKIYNYESQPVLLKIHLEQSGNKFFRINVDGYQGPYIESVEIGAKDSIYIFVEVTVDPDMPVSVSPFIVEDKIIITQGDQNINIVLLAYGQNANYIPGVNRKGAISLLSCELNSVLWDDPKPYVIYGILLIDSCRLEIPEGARLFIHGGLVKNQDFFYNDGLILVLKDGSIDINGSLDRPVVIQGDRLEKAFNNISGQWSGIRILSESKNNVIRNTIIRNSIVGVRVDSAAHLNIYNSIIENTSASGLIGVNSSIYGENLLIHSNEGNAMQLTYGGNYEFNYCTLTNYNTNREALRFDNFVCVSPPFCEDRYEPGSGTLKMSNCIVVGRTDDEISFSDFFKGGEPDFFKYSLSNCIVKVKDLLKPTAFPNFFDNCSDCYNLRSGDKVFSNINLNDFRLDSMSVAIGKGKPIDGISTDITGKIRKTENPDVGCFEL